MRLTGPQYLTTREHKDVFIQLKIQWNIQDKVDSIPYDISCGSTIIVSSLEDHSLTLNMYGCDLQNNYYSKYLSIDNVKLTAVKYKTADGSYIVDDSRVFMVRTTNMNGVDYHILDTGDIYILLDMNKVSTLGIQPISVYEFNTVFPIRNNIEPDIMFSPDSIKIAAKEFVLQDSTDILVRTADSDVYLNYPVANIITSEKKPYIESINGVTMTQRAVGVNFRLGKPANNPALPNIPEYDAKILSIEELGSKEVPSQLPLKFTGIGKNEDIFNTYAFTMNAPVWQYDKADTYCTSATPAWLDGDVSAGVESPDKAIADLKMKVDGNVPMVAMTPANVIAELPEYRMFNTDFASKVTKKVTNSKGSGSGADTGYFKLTKIRKTDKTNLSEEKTYYKDRFAVCDGGTVNFKGTDSGPSLVVLKKDGEQKTVEVEYVSIKKTNCIVSLVASIGKYGNSTYSWDRPHVALYTSTEIPDFKKMESTTRILIIGRADKSGKVLQLKQDHIGTAYFDFSEGGDVYDGTFAIKPATTSATDPATTKRYTISTGWVRIINRRVQILQQTNISISKNSQVYIEATIQGASIKTGTMPTSDNDTTQYYLIGAIDSDGNIKQEHHGGIPLFLFFSTECITEEEGES